MAASQMDQEEIISGINVTPLVDIVLVILIIFIMTASVIFKSGIPMDLPKAKSAEEKAAGLLNLGISKAGTLYINGEKAKLEDIPAAVAKARKRVGPMDEKVSAFVAADVAAQYGTFAKVVDALRIEGVSDIALDTQPAEIPEQ